MSKISVKASISYFLVIHEFGIFPLEYRIFLVKKSVCDYISVITTGGNRLKGGKKWTHEVSKSRFIDRSFTHISLKYNMIFDTVTKHPHCLLSEICPLLSVSHETLNRWIDGKEMIELYAIVLTLVVKMSHFDTNKPPAFKDRRLEYILQYHWSIENYISVASYK